jgi:ATP-dependent RNA helicase DeaD
MERYRVEVGQAHGVKPGNLVGAIANEAGIDSQYIGHIKIYDDHSTIDLPSDLPDDILRVLRKVWVASHPLNISRLEGKRSRGERSDRQDRNKHSTKGVRADKPKGKSKKAKKRAAAKKKKGKQKRAGKQSAA